MKGFKTTVFTLIVFMFGAAFWSAGCDVIEELDKVKEAAEDLVEYELKRAVEEEVEKKVDEKVQEVREEKGLDLFKRKKKGEQAKDGPTTAGKMILRTKKEIKFSSILNLYEIKGEDKGKAVKIPMADIKELTILSSDSDCVWYQIGKEEHSDNCQIQVKKKSDGKILKLTKASIRQGEAKKSRGQCLYLEPGVKDLPQKSMGMRKIKSIVFSK